MKIGIMQPYFFPYIGYFSLISSVDKWIVFDNIQYIRHGWINRNRILHPNPDKEWQYITIPVQKFLQQSLISNIRSDDSQKWRERIMGQLNHYKKFSKRYEEISALVKKSLFTKENHLSEINILALKNVCEYLKINFNYEIFSQMKCDLGEISSPGDWALEISKALGAKEYINPIGGKNIFDLNKFKKYGIKIKFLENKLLKYNQNGRSFISGLSIIDVLMLNKKVNVTKMLKEYLLI